MVVKVFLVVNAKTERLEKIHQTLQNFDEVVFSCIVESGPYDIVAMVEVDTLEGYRPLIERVASIPNTDDFSSFIDTGT